MRQSFLVFSMRLRYFFNYMNFSKRLGTDSALDSEVSVLTWRAALCSCNIEVLFSPNSKKWFIYPRSKCFIYSKGA